MNPRIAINLEEEEEDKYLDNLITLCNDRFPFIDTATLSAEWTRLRDLLTSPARQELCNESEIRDVVPFWQWVTVAQTYDPVTREHEYLFPTLFTLIEIIMFLPHSNAEGERVFSFLNEIKTLKKNKYIPETVCGIAIIKSAMRARGETALTYRVTESQIAKHNSENLYGYTYKVQNNDDSDDQGDGPQGDEIIEAEPMEQENASDSGLTDSAESSDN